MSCPQISIVPLSKGIMPVIDLIVVDFHDLTPKGISDYLNLTKLDYSVISGGNHMIRFI